MTRTAKRKAPKRKTRKPTPTTPTGKVLVLRSCRPDLSGTHEKSGSFVWPKSGPVEAPDWDGGKEVCGGGLHGLPWGEGGTGMLRDEPDSWWLVVEVDRADGYVEFGEGGERKCKFKRGTVVLAEHGDAGKVAAFCRVMCGPEVMARAQKDADENARSGNYSRSASSGNYSRSASSGNSSSSASSGNYSRSASSGDSSSSASSGNSSSSASSGDCSSSASSGDCSSSASSGYSSSSASSGNSSSSAQDGSSGIAAAIGDNVRGKAGPLGLLILTWWDAPAKRHRACVGEVGIDGIKADTWYRVEGGKLVEVA